jgi:hypothetical protein
MTAPTIEVHLKKTGTLTRSGNDSDTLLDPETLRQIQSAISDIASAFKPPIDQTPPAGIALSEFQLELGFSLEGKAGSIIKLVFDGSVSSQLKAIATWKRY